MRLTEDIAKQHSAVGFSSRGASNEQLVETRNLRKNVIEQNASEKCECV